jgi:hypothetical protein
MTGVKSAVAQAIPQGQRSKDGEASWRSQTDASITQLPFSQGEEGAEKEKFLQMRKWVVIPF